MEAPKTAIEHVGPSAHLTATPGKDPEWLPQARSKSTQTRYSGKCKSKKSVRRLGTPSSYRDACHGFPTQYLNRVLQAQSSGSDSADSEAHNDHVRPDNKQRSSQTSSKSTSLADEAQRGLVLAFENLIRTTQPPATPQGFGNSTLMRTCLRKVPQYIALEGENDDGERNDKDSDLSFEIYSELEMLGSDSASGWVGLREVVRSHAVSRVTDAVRAGLLSRIVVHALAEACLGANAARESQSILDAWLDGPSSVTAKEVKLCLVFSEANGSWSTFFQSAATLLDEGKLHPLIINSNESVWRETLRCLVSFDTRASGIRFTQSYLNACDRLEPPCEISHGFRDLMTTLTAMAVTDTTKILHSKTMKESIAYAIYSIVPQSMLSSGKQMQMTTANKILLTNWLVLQACSCPPDSNLVSLDIGQLSEYVAASDSSQAEVCPGSKNIITGFKIIGDMASFLSGLGGVGQDALEHIIRSILRVSSTLPESLRDHLTELALDGARTYVDEENSERSLTFVEEIEDIIADGAQAAPKETPMKQPEKQTNAYRWEGGLCEWIAKTPLAMSLIDTDDLTSTSSPKRTTLQVELMGHFSDSVGFENKFGRREFGDPASVDAMNHEIHDSSCGETGPDDNSDDDDDELALFASVKKVRRKAEDLSRSSAKHGTQFRNDLRRHMACAAAKCQDFETSDDELGF